MTATSGPPEPASSGPSARVDAVAARLRAAGCVFAEDEAGLVLAQAASDAEVEAMVARRAAGEPLEVVLGWAAFGGLRVTVAPGVFVPRMRTEHLAARAVAAARRAAASGRTPVVVDLCCGSGAIARVVAAAVPGCELHAADIDPAAVACARVNLAPVRAQVHHGDLDRALPRSLAGRVAVLVANVPYVPSAALATLPVEARVHEPVVALDGGPDGLAVVRRVAACARGWVRPGGTVMVETTRDQAPAAARAFAGHGFAARAVTDHDRDATVIEAVAPGAG